MNHRTSSFWTQAALVVLLIAGCSGDVAEPLSPELEELSRALRGVAEASSDETRGAAVAAMEAVLADTGPVCESCRHRIALRQVGEATIFVIDMEDASGALALVHLVHRPGLEPGELGGWAATRVRGQPADLGEGRQLTLWAGSFELRVFPGRADRVDEAALRAIAESLPVGDFARL